MVKDFIKELKLKKMKTTEIAALIADNQKDLIDFYIKESHRAKNAELKKELFNKMMNEKFPKALKKIIKNAKENGEGLDCGFAVIIGGLIETNSGNELLTDELISEYADIINKLLKPRAKKISKKVDIDENIIRELLIITPDKEYISADKFVGIYSQRMLRKLYFMATDHELNLTEISQVETLFKKLFGKKLVDLIAVNILLEKKDYIKNFNEKQLAVWNLMTNFALDYINNESKEHIGELLEYYCMRRRADASKDRDVARRIELRGGVNAETYPKLAKCIAKFEKNGKQSLVKFL